MASYSSKNAKSEYRYSVSFKVTWETHSLVDEITSITGRAFSTILRELLDLGIKSWNSNNPGVIDKAKLDLLVAYNNKRNKQELKRILASLKGNVDEEEFDRHCRANNQHPEEFQEIDTSEWQLINSRNAQVS